MSNGPCYASRKFAWVGQSIYLHNHRLHRQKCNWTLLESRALNRLIGSLNLKEAVQPRMTQRGTATTLCSGGNKPQRAAMPQPRRSAHVLGRSDSRNSECVTSIGSRPNFLQCCARGRAHSGAVGKRKGRNKFPLCALRVFAVKKHATRNWRVVVQTPRSRTKRGVHEMDCWNVEIPTGRLELPARNRSPSSRRPSR